MNVSIQSSVQRLRSPSAVDGHGQIVEISEFGLDRLMPMHLRVTPSGHICSVGPTLDRLFHETPLTGQRFLEVFEVQRPRHVRSISELGGAEGGQLRLRMRRPPHSPMKGLVTILPGVEGMLINLSFGYGIVDAVRHFDMNCGDFAITDLTIEMLYLIEAKSAAQTEQKKLNMKLRAGKQEAEKAALTDGLTGLANRRAFDAALSSKLEGGSDFGVMHIDLDSFKVVNDTKGHAAGDRVLQRVAIVLNGQTRSSDVVARMGGDEFTILFDRFRDTDKLHQVATRIISQIEIPMQFDGELCEISASIGITTTSLREYTSEASILKDADLALYASKFKGKAQATIFKPELEAFVEAEAQKGGLART